jgi:hypothetical protein
MGGTTMRENMLPIWGFAALIILFALSNGSLSKDSSVIVNTMIDVNSYANPSPDQINETHKSLIKLVNGIDAKRLNATYYLSGDAVQTERLYLTYLGELPRRELAMGGNSIGEKLESMSSVKQDELLARMKKIVKACHVCGGKTIEPKGFRPQSYSQNEDTFKILDKMGIVYDAGFKAGILYQPGHENDNWPYRIDNHNLIAVPISSYNISGEQIYLSDRYIKEEKKLSGSQWYDILTGKFDESAKTGNPMVVVFDNLISGKDTEYLDAYLRFIKFATSRNATFVTTIELVNMSISRNPTNAIQSSAIETVSNTTTTKCVVCETLKNATIEETGMENNTTKETPIKMAKPVMTE